MTLVRLVDLVDPGTPKKSKVKELGSHNPVRVLLYSVLNFPINIRLQI